VTTATCISASFGKAKSRSHIFDYDYNMRRLEAEIRISKDGFFMWSIWRFMLGWPSALVARTSPHRGAESPC
jgi:hypothetical protein